ncbi:MULTISPECIES: FliH/SctL family protein [Arcobacteraceae]|uniref:FliH/SctL family protein n=1 Tax=Arcobacteraceae TaxID=2808963 RepID=UPI000DEB8016|nr:MULTISPECIES: FliH/SctL family protein [Arcobacteraceae]MBL3519851.1 flagellar assembly protein FliH [Aliarcobacter lanthieri]RBQ25974.1 flagellar assembly protein FliH [Arcobacter sp. CECT 9188]
MAENVYSTAKVVRADDNIQKFELSSFNKKNLKVDKEESQHFVPLKIGDEEVEQTTNIQNLEEKKHIFQEPVNIVDNSEVLEKIEPIFLEFEKLTQKIEQVSQKVTMIEQDAITKGKDLDAQVVKAIKDLKQYATFFEQATFQLESKLLKTSITIAQKIINIEVGENSTKIAKQTINQLLLKLKNASKVKIHLNPKDYHILKKDLELEPFIELSEDANVVAGGVVIASDLGNYDGSIEAKVSSMLESLDLVI